jgi:hypothetical protein
MPFKAAELADVLRGHLAAENGAGTHRPGAAGAAGRSDDARSPQEVPA